jgi:hypothetical protein
MNALAPPISMAARVCGLVLTAALAAPALAAAAPTVKADLACYPAGRPIPLSGTGYTAGGDVSVFVSLSGKHGSKLLFLRDPLKATAAGAISTQLPGLDLASDNDLRETVTVTANDQALMGQVPALPAEETFGMTQFQLSAVDVIVSPWMLGHVNPRALTTMKVVGWAPFHKVYAHYLLNGKRVKTVLIGSVSGPCGELTKKVRQFPFRPVPAGSYRIRFSPKQVYDPDGFWIGYRDIVVPKAKAVR